jgi:hypothetical protein
MIDLNYKIRSSMFLKSIFVFAIIFFNVEIFAGQLKYQYRSANFLGRGDAGMANVSGGDAMFYNPAGIYLGENRLHELYLLSPQAEGSNNLMTIYDKKDQGDTQLLAYLVENSRRTSYAAVQNLSAIVFKHFAIGAMQRGDIRAAIESSNSIPHVYINGNYWNGFYSSFASSFFNQKLLIGVTGKYIQKRQYDLDVDSTQVSTLLQNTSLKKLFENTEKVGISIGSDIGAIFVLHKETNTHLGFALKNLSSNYDWKDSVIGKVPDSDPKELNAGFSTSFGTRKSRIKLFADYKDVLNEQNVDGIYHFHAGAEYSLKNVLTLDIGVNDGRITYAGGLNFKVIKFEVGSYAEVNTEIDDQVPDVRFFGRISVGWLL